MNELPEELKQQYQNCNQKQLNYAFQEACSYGYLDIVRYLLTSSELTVHADINANNESGFGLACGYGYLPVVQYLLTSPELKVHANINANKGFGFKWACQNGQLEIVKYLLTSEELMKHVDIHIANDGGFKFACSEQCLEIVKYLLSFNGIQSIHFQQTNFNLDWAMENKYDDIILTMMQNLQINDPIEYVGCLVKIQRYNMAMYEGLKNLSVENVKINFPESELFL